jgi:hypothetical protein
MLQESGDDGFDTDSYSGIVDLNSLSGGTPVVQRRRETLCVSERFIKYHFSAIFTYHLQTDNEA